MGGVWGWQPLGEGGLRVVQAETLVASLGLVGGVCVPRAGCVEGGGAALDSGRHCGFPAVGGCWWAVLAGSGCG